MLIWHVISFCHTRRSQMIPDSFFTCSAGFIFHTGDISRDCAPRVSHMISYGIAHTWNVGEFSVNIVFVSEALTFKRSPFLFMQHFTSRRSLRALTLFASSSFFLVSDVLSCAAFSHPFGTCPVSDVTFHCFERPHSKFWRSYIVRWTQKVQRPEGR